MFNGVRKILHLAFPMASIQFITMGSGFLCMAMLAKLGQDVLAASALIFAIQMSMNVIGMSVLFSLGVLIGHAYGEKNYSVIGNFIQQGWVLGCLVSAPIMIIYWNIIPILKLLNQPAHLIPYVGSFFHIYMWAVPALLFAVCNQQFCYAIRKPIWSVIAGVLSVVMLLSSAYIFIFGKLGLPELGVKGLAYAMVLQLWFGFMFMILVFNVRKEFKIFDLFNFRIHKDWGNLARMFKLGWPISLQMGGEMLSFAFGMTMVGWLGTIPLAANQVTIQYLFISLVPIFALSHTSAILIGHARGERQHDEIKKLGNTTLIITFIYTLIIGALFITMPQTLANLYFNVSDPNNAQTLHFVILLFMIMAASQIFDGARHVVTGALRGLLDSKFPMYTGLVSIWLIGIPLSYLLAFTFHLGVIGVALGNLGGVIFATSILLHRWIAQSNRSVND